MAAIGTAAWAQNCTPKAEDYEKFKSTKTAVVLDGNMWSDFNVAIKKDMANEWGVTSFEFVSQSKMEKMRGDSNYSFLTTTTVTYPEDKVKAKYTYLSLLLGKKTAKLRDMPDLISIPLSYERVDDQSKWVYKLPALIRFMLNHVADMTADPKLIDKSPLLRYHKNRKSLSNKTLYLLKDELDSDIQTEAAVKKVYPYKFKFASREEIHKAIEEKRDDVVFLHKVGPENNSKTRCYKMLLSAGTAEVYYFDYHMINGRNPDCLRADDLEDIAKK